MDKATVLQIIEIIIRIVATVLIGYVCPKFKGWLTEKIGEQKAVELESLVLTFVQAAEQMYKTEDPDGTIRNTYVKAELEKAGYIITSEVNSMIESAVWELNNK